jgi:hypothetical protein
MVGTQRDGPLLTLTGSGDHARVSLAIFAICRCEGRNFNHRQISADECGLRDTDVASKRMVIPARAD